MNAKKVLRYMKDREQGFRWEDNYEPAGEVELFGDDVPCGRQVKRTVTNNGVTEDVDVWTPPVLKGEGSHRPPRASRESVRSWLTDPTTNREIGSSSHLEMKCTYQLMANRRVIEIIDQHPTVSYPDENGELHQTRYDFMFTLDDTRKIAIAIKPADKVEKRGLNRIIRASLPELRKVADDAIILTDIELSAERLWNNKTILRARRLRNQSDVDFLLRELGQWHGVFSAFDLARLHPSVARGEVAVWLLIYEGVLKMLHPERRLCDAPSVFVEQSMLARKLNSGTIHPKIEKENGDEL